MRNEHKQQLVEQYEDVAVSLFMDKYAEADGVRLLQEYEDLNRSGELPEIPAELDEKCRKLIKRSFAKQERQLRNKRIRISVAKVAVIALVLLGLSTATVLTVDAFRVPVLNFLQDSSGRYSTVVLEPNSSAIKTDMDHPVERFEQVIPKGYQVISHEFSGPQGTVICKDLNGHIIYLHIAGNECELNVDAENVEYTELDFGEYSAVFWDKEGYTLMWLDSQNQTVYTFYANGVTIDTFWELAYAMIE